MKDFATTAWDRPARGLAHGGRLAEARALFPHAPEPLIDLSTGINPIPYPIPPVRPEWLTRLPEPEDLASLQATAARAYGVIDPAMVVAAPGTQILIDLLPRLWPAQVVAVVGPTYNEYSAAWARCGCKIVELQDLAAARAADVAVVCNPNNPDGRRFARADVLDLADLMADRRGLAIVDEAFADLEPDGLSVADALPHPALVVLRSFGKTYGLAGLRLGFALASPDRASHIRAALGPWAVSGVAVGIGRQALADRQWLSCAIEACGEAADRLNALLRRAGCRIVGGTRLFRLAECGDAAAVFTRLGERGIFVRRFAEHRDRLRFGLPGVEPDWLRVEAALAGSVRRDK